VLGPASQRAPFGFSVGVGGGLVAVNEGFRFRLFRAVGVGQVWEETGEFRYYPYGAEDHSGLAVSGRRVLFGSYLDETLGFEAGAAWVFPLPGALTPLEPAPGEPGGLALTVAPNPTAGRAAVHLTVRAPSDVRAAVYDLLGRAVAVLHEGPLAAGQHRLGWEAGALSPGLYLVRAEAGGEAVSRAVTVAR
jgi:hypothetical protein